MDIHGQRAFIVIVVIGYIVALVALRTAVDGLIKWHYRRRRARQTLMALQLHT